MKIIIDIQDEQYSLIMQSHRSGIERFIDKEGMMYAIKNGKPFFESSVVDKIRSDINKLTVYYTTKDKGINLISQKAVNRIFDKYNT